jgi:hypothetical protein
MKSFGSVSLMAIVPDREHEVALRRLWHRSDTAGPALGVGEVGGSLLSIINDATLQSSEHEAR